MTNMFCCNVVLWCLASPNAQKVACYIYYSSIDHVTANQTSMQMNQMKSIILKLEVSMLLRKQTMTLTISNSINHHEVVNALSCPKKSNSCHKQQTISQMHQMCIHIPHLCVHYLSQSDNLVIQQQKMENHS